MIGGRLFIDSDGKVDPKWKRPISVDRARGFEFHGRVRWIGGWGETTKITKGVCMKRMLCALTISLLAGCAMMSPQEQAAFQQQMVSTQPHCISQRQCEAAWSAARNWVNTNCGMKIQTMTDSYIETYNSTDTSLACRVTKDPDPSGGYALSITISCGNMFGCVPDAHPSALAFNREVKATTDQFASN